MVIREEISVQSNYRATDSFQNWLKKNKLVGIFGVDTRQITQILREKGSVNAVIEYKKNRKFNFKEITNYKYVITSNSDSFRVLDVNKIFKPVKKFDNHLLLKNINK